MMLHSVQNVIYKCQIHTVHVLVYSTHIFPRALKLYCVVFRTRAYIPTLYNNWGTCLPLYKEIRNEEGAKSDMTKVS
jgi:hypothetical protein